jgi:formamidopyrimidine-DNA glycosylase
MPELPEVETLRRSLRPLLGRTIARVDVRTPVAIRTHRPRRFAALLTGRRLASVNRAGKALLIGLTGRLVLVVHFKLWGLLRFHPEAAAQDAGTALLLRFRADGSLEFRELQLSTIELHAEKDLGTVPYLAKLGTDPLSAAFTRSRFREVMRGRAAVRAILTDQARIAGIGNLWALEILHAARVRPDRPAASLTPEELGALFAAIRTVLRRGIAQGGEPDFADAFGRKGRVSLAVYGRTGQSCPRRDGTVVAARFGGRPSFYCPGCQR